MPLFSQLFKSLYSPKEMARFRFQKIGKTILYILLLAILMTIPEMIQADRFVKEQFITLQDYFQKDVPNFSIENGTLKADSQNRVKKVENDYTFLFDPNGIETSISPSETNGLYLLKDRFVMISNGQKQSYTYSSMSQSSITKTEILDFFTYLKSIYPIAILIIGISLCFINSFTSFFGVTLLAFIGTVLSKQMNRRLSYKQIWTLTTYSITIPTIFFMIMKYLRIAVLSPLLIFTLVTLVLLYITVREVPTTTKKIK
ncbi:DUF1189 domain-containing protein [Ectobacillus polymachus]|uniref:DUF1189 domain-containing protein n=1 Tax=Ectobacillus polymachus TaxID=1508806 RepID=UPI003A89CEAA